MFDVLSDTFWTSPFWFFWCSKCVRWCIWKTFDVPSICRPISFDVPWRVFISYSPSPLHPKPSFIWFIWFSCKPSRRNPGVAPASDILALFCPSMMGKRAWKWRAGRVFHSCGLIVLEKCKCDCNKGCLETNNNKCTKVNGILFVLKCDGVHLRIVVKWETLSILVNIFSLKLLDFL